MLRKRATFEKEAHVLVKNGLDDLQIEDDSLDLSSWNNILIPNVDSSFSQPKGAIDDAVSVVVSLNVPTSQLFLRVVVKSRANVFGVSLLEPVGRWVMLFSWKVNLMACLEVKLNFVSDVESEVSVC